MTEPDRQLQTRKGGKGFEQLRAKPDDIFASRNPTRIAVRVERTMKMVSRRLLLEYEATGGETLEELGIDPDLPLAKVHAEIVRRWANGPDGLLGYIAQFGHMDQEVAAIHIIRIYVEGELISEEEL